MMMSVGWMEDRETYRQAIRRWVSLATLPSSLVSSSHFTPAKILQALKITLLSLLLVPQTLSSTGRRSICVKIAAHSLDIPWAARCCMAAAADLGCSPVTLTADCCTEIWWEPR